MEIMWPVGSIPMHFRHQCFRQLWLPVCQSVNVRWTFLSVSASSIQHATDKNVHPGSVDPPRIADRNKSSNEPVNFDVDFSVPQRHRVRFTNDLAGRDFEVLTELMVASDDVVPPPKVLLIIDQGVAETSLTNQLVSRLATSNQIRLMNCGSVLPLLPASGSTPKGPVARHSNARRLIL